jgi:hypothetical protein
LKISSFLEVEPPKINSLIVKILSIEFMSWKL